MVPPAPATPDPHLAARNLDAALQLLEALGAGGVEHWVVCPGSRSGPLARAVGLLVAAGRGRLHTAIDERSAAFFALGLGLASGEPAAVITTSGTAVANLLPAAVEADHGGVPLLLLTADRPERLKGCGANQTVNQEAFLVPAVRWLGQGNPRGVAAMDALSLAGLAAEALAHCRGRAGQPAGPVHLNLPFDEPLHADGEALRRRAEALAAPGPLPPQPPAPPRPLATPRAQPPLGLGGLDPDHPGLVVAGPWRGHPRTWDGFVQALERWQRRTGWPVLADGLSGLRGCRGLELVAAYDLVGSDLPPTLAAGLSELQVLRLGPLPASRRLQALLEACGGPQLLINEGDPRPLDPLGRCARQWPAGLEGWLAQLPPAALAGEPGPDCRLQAAAWQALERRLQGLLDQQLPAAWGEPALARRLARSLPSGLPVLLANSSPVRDWETFAGHDGPALRLLGCRGASGIDGTLSIACGVAAAAGRALLLSGDLALLHDSNGWLWRRQLQGRLLVVLIDNGGGGIFEQLPIRHQDFGHRDSGSVDTANGDWAGTDRSAADPCVQDPAALDFERLFAMPQAVDQAALAAAHGVPSRQLEHGAGLEEALAWGLQQPLALLVLRTDRRADAAWRQALRRMACSLADSP